MRRDIYILCMLMALKAWNSGCVKAQEVVLKGSTHRYSIIPVCTKADYGFHWSVSGGTSSILSNSSASNDITWDGSPGLYTVSLYPFDAKTGCLGNTRNLKIKVVDFYIRWQGVSSTVCSAYGNDDRDFSIVAEFTQTNEIWSFEYQIDNLKPMKITVDGGSSKIINISGFINHSTHRSEVHQIRITKIITPEGCQITFDGKERDASSRIYTVTVNPVPPPGKIEFVRDL